MTEPILTAEDRRIWRQFQRAALAWSKSRVHAGRVAAAARHVETMAKRVPDAYVSWSAGKDSTAMVHLVRVACGVPGKVISVKDDLDFPDELGYIDGLAQRFGLDVDVVTPGFSLQDWLRHHPTAMAGDDHHSRGAALSLAAFYPIVDQLAESWPGVYLGLRSEESLGRAENRRFRGPVYQRSGGHVVCQPICDWRGIDVYAYLLSNGIDPLPMYRCVRFHRDPSRVRKSWWVPCAAGSEHTGATWLRTYYPSLYRRLCELLPDAAQMA